MNILNFCKTQRALNYSVSPNHSKRQSAAEDIHADNVQNYDDPELLVTFHLCPTLAPQDG